MTLLDRITIGPLAVLIDSATGSVVAVQDALTGCAASLLYTRSAIQRASAEARLVWESTADCYA